MGMLQGRDRQAGMAALSGMAARMPPMSPVPPPPVQPRNPLHGVTLEAMVLALVEHYGWTGLAERLPVRCFQSDPSVASSLKFLRKTPWARAKLESLYLFMRREHKRAPPGR
jgi:DNA-binding protein VF530